MKTDRDSWIKIKNGDKPSNGSVAEFKLAGTLKRTGVLSVLFIAGIHFFAYQQVFRVLFEGATQVLAFSLCYAAGIGLLSWQCLNFLIHLQLVHLQTFEALRAHAIWRVDSSQFRLSTLSLCRVGVKWDVLSTHSPRVFLDPLRSH